MSVTDLPLFVWIILFSLLGGLISVMAAAVLLCIPEARRLQLLPSLVSLAIGALLAAAFVGLIPHAANFPGIDMHQLGMTVLAGILIFFALEKTVLWRHSHAHEHGHSHPDNIEQGRAEAAAVMILVGDGIHNLVDGMLIGAAFLADFHLGVMTSLAVAAHEIPQELGDFVILLHSGMRSARALLLNLLSGLATVVGALLAWSLLSDAWLPYALAIAAASFIYVAVADLIPGLQRHTGVLNSLRELGLIAVGVVAISAMHYGLHP
ncbi:MAG: ZIP family metal transporter [Salinisphaeraceae bacterium]|nr:ZIP family metal transporter [Salinisphaeraceae bacterium]